jgi:hypothetical protein
MLFLPKPPADHLANREDHRWSADHSLRNTGVAESLDGYNRVLLIRRFYSISFCTSIDVVIVIGIDFYLPFGHIPDISAKGTSISVGCNADILCFGRHFQCHFSFNRFHSESFLQKTMNSYVLYASSVQNLHAVELRPNVYFPLVTVLCQMNPVRTLTLFL